MECKQALSETKGNLDEAVDVLRKKGIAKAAKKSGRETSEGAVGSYVHMGGKIAVLVEVNCETDFVAKTDEFQAFVRDLAMHIAGANPVPRYVTRDQVPPEDIEHEKEIIAAQPDMAGKPEAVRGKIIEGRISKFLGEISLMDQAFVKDPDHTVAEVLHRQIAKLGENISIRRFVRFQLGGD